VNTPRLPQTLLGPVSPMPHADTLDVVHHDDTRTRFKDVRYQLHRDGIRIWSDEGEQLVTDVLMTQAYRQRKPQ
jgi:hypothetical protein